MDKHLWHHKLFQQRNEKSDNVFVVQWVSGVLARREDPYGFVIRFNSTRVNAKQFSQEKKQVFIPGSTCYRAR